MPQWHPVIITQTPAYGSRCCGQPLMHVKLAIQVETSCQHHVTRGKYYAWHAAITFRGGTMNKKTQDLLVTLFPIVLMIIASVLYFVSPLALAWFLGALIVGPIIYVVAVIIWFESRKPRK